MSRTWQHFLRITDFKPIILVTKVTHLFEYPLKSSRGNALTRADIGTFGMGNDRRFAVVDDGNRIITGRQHPRLLLIESKIKGNNLYLKGPAMEDISIAIGCTGPAVAVTLFGAKVYGTRMLDGSSEWLSKMLAGNFRLFRAAEHPDLNVRKESRTGFVDSAPIHLISLRSLEYLNSKLGNHVGPENFRPNIVVDGARPFEEDNWTALTVNGCKMQVQSLTKRCVLTTVDPWQGMKNTEVEPLASLAKYRSSNGLPITFGLDLVPIGNCVLNVGDQIEYSD